MKIQPRIYLLALWGALIIPVLSERYCGYKGDLSARIQQQLDDCYKQNVIESRVRMSLGFEHCFGFNYERLNSTVEAPFEKRLNDTSRHVLHLAFRICSAGDNGLDEDFYVLDASGNSLSEVEDQIGLNSPTQTPENIRSCKSFFQKLLDALALRDFKVSDLLSQHEKLIAPLIPSSDSRGKLFTLVGEIVRPLSECRDPMAELRATLIKKYLKQYLIDLIAPTMPSFTNQSYDVLLHPEMYLINAGGDLGKDFGGEEPVVSRPSYGASLLGSQRVVVLHKRTDSEVLTRGQKEDVREFDADNEGKSPAQIAAEIQARADKRDLDKVDKLVMTPSQKLKNGLISPEQYAKLIALPESHEHQGEPIEIEKFWDDNLVIKKKRFNNEDFDRYKIRGFDIDQKIKELFRPKTTVRRVI